MSESALPLAGALLSLLGALLFLVSAIGLLRLPDFYTRAHAPAKAATLGLLLAAAGSILTYGLGDAAYWLEKVLLVVFVLITVPISTQMLVRGAAARGVPQAPHTRGAPTGEPIERLDGRER
ncbi:MAG: monovalent cation/H(+) antiporter subunit G [Myxococcota bacterium]|nr:monovalent cation/H(+) antiporter subunit G [Myxococcota bacterium]